MIRRSVSKARELVFLLLGVFIFLILPASTLAEVDESGIPYTTTQSSNYSAAGTNASFNVGQNVTVHGNSYPVSEIRVYTTTGDNGNKQVNYAVRSGNTTLAQWVELTEDGVTDYSSIKYETPDGKTSGGGTMATNNNPSWITDPVAAAKNEVVKGIEGAFSKIGDFLLKYVGLFFMIIGLLISWIANAFLYITAQVLEASFSMLVTNMGTYSELWSAVQDGWKAIRDIGNTLFIFVLLYAAFNTVLGRKDGLDLVPRIIIVALLVNFSYLFSTSVIDVSNELAAKVYGQIGQGAGSAGFSGQLAKLGGYEKLMTSFSLDSIGSTISNAISNASGAVSAAQQSTSVLAGFGSFVKSVFSAAFIFILGGFMLAISLTLVARFVTLVVLVVVSSLAFLAYLLPRFEGQSREWWASLIGQSFYAPAIFLMLLVTTGIAEKFQQSIGATQAVADGKLASLFSFGLSQFFTFCILIGMLYASMSLAKKLSEQGSKAAISIGQRAQKYAASAAFGGAGWLGRGTLGRAGGRLADSDSVKNWSVQSGIKGYVGRKLMGVGGRMNESSFDFRQSGAATALQAATGAEYGNAGKAAQGGWQGVVEAKEKEAAARIDAVKGLDLSGKDKKTKIEELAKKAGSSSALGIAHAQVAATKASLDRRQEAYDQARASGNAAQIAQTEGFLKLQKQAHERAVDRRDDLGYEVLNEKVFGVKGSKSRDINYSSTFAQSRLVDERRMANLKHAGILATVGVAAAPLSLAAGAAGTAAAAVSALSGGIAIHNVVRRTSLKHKASVEAANKHIKAAQGIAKDRKRLEYLESLESRGATLSKPEERERKKLEDKFDKIDNAAKVDKKDDKK